MTLSHGFRQLANVIETLEADGLDVHDVATADDEPSDGLTVELTVTVPLDATESATESTLSDGSDAGISAATSDQTDQPSGGVRERVLDPLAVRTDETNGASAIEPASPETSEDADSVDDDATGETDDGGDVVECPIADCDETFESDHGMKIHRTKVHGDEVDGTDEGAPAYRDPERLREVYAECDSFPEMREALGTDVSTQTVRRQMIAHDIYEPGESAAGSGTETDAGDEEETDETEADDEDSADERASDEGNADEPASSDVQADEESADEESELDAIELPEGVSVADLKAAVASSQTLYDVQQCFDLDREAAMQLLDTYDLLDIVHGRVSNRDARKQVDEDEITRRILEHAPVSQPSRA